MKEKEKRAFGKYTAMLGDRESYCIFSGRPEWDGERYTIPATSPKKRTEWVMGDKIEETLLEYVIRGWPVWVSLNEKELGTDRIIGVSRVKVIWFDVDAKRSDKSRPAGEREKEVALKEARTVKEELSKRGLKGFIACSGNGYHLFYPVDFALPGKEFRKEFNEKLKRVYQQIRERTGIEFDTTTDLRRVTQPIGFPNMKIPDNPIDTYWVDDFNEEDIKRAREVNYVLIKKILNTRIKEEEKIEPKKAPLRFEDFLKGNEKARDLYSGFWGKYKYKSRSEAEEAFVIILCMEGFRDEQIKEIMRGCKIGKWQEKDESYYNITMRKGRAYAEELHKREEEERKRRKERGRPEKVDTGAILDDLFDRYKFVTAIDTEDVYVYRDGIYEQGEVLVKEEVEKIVGNEATEHLVSEIIGHIQRRTYTPRERFNENKYKVPVANGLLNLNNFELEAHDPEQIYTFKLAVEYKPDAECPKILKFISEILREEDIPLIQEFFGYVFYPAMPAHKSLWLYGTGRNGKTTLLTLLQDLIGDKNIVSVPFEDLDGIHRFSVARLYGRLLNIVSEPTTIRRVNTPVFKRLIGSDFVSAEVKNKQNTIDFVNFAKFIVSGNRFPIIDDSTFAFWYRVMTVEFPYTFTENAIPKLAEKLIEEEGLSGFLNWCLVGLKRLIENNFRFGESKNTERIKTEFEKVSNSARAFVESMCDKNPRSILPKNELYGEYKNYCEEENLTVMRKADLTRVISEMPGIKETIEKVGGKVQRCWRGIAIEDIEKQIYQLINKIIQQDSRGTLIKVLVQRLSDFGEERVREKIDEMIEEGNLLVNKHDETGTYVVRG